MTQEETEQQIQQSKLSLDQLKLEQNELANRYGRAKYLIHMNGRHDILRPF